MPTNDERRDVARKLREAYAKMMSPGLFEPQGMSIQAMNYLRDIERCVPDGDSLLLVLADLIDPDNIPDNPDETGRPLSEPVEGWTSFDDRLPDPDAPVLCKSKNGAVYVGKPVTTNGSSTNAVWVPRGGEYRAPAAWRPIEAPTSSNEASTGVCRIECKYVVVDDYDVMECKECGCEFPVFEFPNYCPGCGAKAVWAWAEPRGDVRPTMRSVPA